MTEASSSYRSWFVPNGLMQVWANSVSPYARALRCVTGSGSRSNSAHLRPDFRSRLPRHLLENSLYDAGTDAERSSDLENAVTLGPQFQDPLLHRGFDPASA